MEKAANLENVIEIETEQCEEQKEKCCILKSKMPKISKAKQRKIAKVGLASTLALTTVSGFFDVKYAKKLHITSGLALVGFAAWHASLYKKSKKSEIKTDCEN